MKVLELHQQIQQPWISLKDEKSSNSENVVNEEKCSISMILPILVKTRISFVEEIDISTIGLSVW